MYLILKRMGVRAISVFFVMLILKEARGLMDCKTVDEPFLYFYKSSVLNSHCLTCISFEEQSQYLHLISCISDNVGVTLEDLQNENYLNSNRRLPVVYYESQQFSRSFMIIIKPSTHHNYYDHHERAYWTSNAVISLDFSDVTEFSKDLLYIHRYPDLIDLNLKNTSLVMDPVTLNLTKLQVINLSHNKIKAVQKSNFEHLVSLFKLDLSYNEIDILPADVFDKQSHLEELVLNNNKLMRFDIPIKNISQFILPSLDLSFNKIADIQLNGFFRKLNLSHNKLSRFPFNLSSVTKSLDLSYNLLTTIDAYTLTNVSSLEVINIKHNLLSSLNTISLLSERLIEVDISHNLFTLSSNGRNNNWLFVFMHSPHLRQVSLSGNLWTCPDLRDIIHILKARNVSIVQGNTYGKTNVMGIECSASPSNSTPEDSSTTFNQHIEKILFTIQNQTATNNASQDVAQQISDLVSKMEQMEQNFEKIKLGTTIRGNNSIVDQVYSIMDAKLAKIKNEVIEINKDKISMTRMEQQLMALTSKLDFANSKESNNGHIFIIVILLFLLFSAMICLFFLYSKNKKLRKGVESENVGLVNI